MCPHFQRRDLCLPAIVCLARSGAFGYPKDASCNTGRLPSIVERLEARLQLFAGLLGRLRGGRIVGIVNDTPTKEQSQ